MLHVKDGLVEQLGDVLVVECVDHATPSALADDEAEVAQLAELMGYGRWLQPDRGGKLAHRARPVSEPPEDLHAARCGQNLHAFGHHPRQLAVDLCGPGAAGDSVAHVNIC